MRALCSSTTLTPLGLGLLFWLLLIAWVLG